MSLTSHEQRQLERIEAALIAETPGLNRFLKSAPMGERRRVRLRRNWLILGVIACVLGLAIVALGIRIGNPAPISIGPLLVLLSPLVARWGPALHAPYRHRHRRRSGHRRRIGLRPRR